MSHLFDNVKGKIEDTLEKVHRRLSHDSKDTANPTKNDSAQNQASKPENNMGQDSGGNANPPNYGQQAQNAGNSMGQNAQNLGQQAQNLGQQSMPQPNAGGGPGAPGGYNQ
ncbi:hypothetical protein LPJ53_000028 [Coemansia erecta]|uniref:Uncharacterized protein n=1 Tax=Coemansia erecta TaxID=147472 RepID=A0A9W7Y751_9FUNG|nr:hypothetical protein LPJ53_000028 [Coemansia erecta]